MKKILILQPMGDAAGGIFNVNKTLAKCFRKNNDECYLFSVRNGGYKDNLDFSDFTCTKVINPKGIWGLIKGREILSEVKNRNYYKALKMLFSRIIYKISLKKDFINTKKAIKKLSPDIIICSHYELLDVIPKNSLKRTIMHYHTNFGTVIDNHSCKRYFNKYKDKIGKFVWLTESTSNQAKAFGLYNSIYIYNPVRIASEKVADVVNNKSLIFLGRISNEKRVNLLLRIFDEVCKENDIDEWTLKLYGMGELDNEAYQIIDNNPKIVNYGPTDKIKEVFINSSLNLNTSVFEGLSMTILEGNECGVPTLSFDFGETVGEQIIDGQTGIIVKQDDIEEYKNKLKELMTNPSILKHLSVNCKEFSNKFSVDIIFNEWEKLINDILKNVVNV